MVTWAQRIAAPGGSTAMLGTGQRALTYAALQWNAERCEREGLGRSCRLTLVGLVTGAEANASAVAVGGSDAPARTGGIERIDVDTFAFAALDSVAVRSDLHARFSLPACLATLALDGELVAASFLPERLDRAEMHELAGRVRIREASAYTAALPHERPSKVTVHWGDGTRASHEVRNASGNPDRPMSRSQVAGKFRSNVASVLASSTIDAFTTDFPEPPEMLGNNFTQVARDIRRLHGE